MGAKVDVVVLKTLNSAKIIKWKVKEGAMISVGRVILIYELDSSEGQKEQRKLKSTQVGTIKRIIAKEEDIIQPGEPLLELEECRHPTVMKDMCAECGADLTKIENNITNASVSMVHSVPELKVSQEQAQILGNEDKERLINLRKLVLLVDLDQTLIHTTNDDVPPNLKDVYHFQLQQNGPWYHTRLRPHTHNFLKQMTEYYELHICTFGARNYAHAIANILDKDGTFFSHRILSRDECFDPNSKTANLKALFPCGDDMVCIIDDREDVWSYLPNLIHVKPYHFFKHTGDINAPPGLTKQENDDKHGIEFKNTDKNYKNVTSDNNFEEKLDVDNKDCLDSESSKNVNKDKNLDMHDIKEETNKIANGNIELSLENTQSQCKKNENSTVEPTKETTISESESEEKTKSDEEIKDLNLTNNDNLIKLNESEQDKSKILGKDNSELKTDIQEVNLENSNEMKEDNASEPNEQIMEEETKEDLKPEIKSENKENLEKEEIDENKKTHQEELDIDDDDDDYLLYLADILKTIHSAYYELYDQSKEISFSQELDLKKVIPYVRRKVLAGFNLVLSGLVPTHTALKNSRAYRVARALGANVSEDFLKSTTHLVAAVPGTAKANTVKKRFNKIKVVSPQWLWVCAERWQHVDERLFPLVHDGTNQRHPPPHCSPEHPSRVAAIAAGAAAAAAEYYRPVPRKRTPSGRFADTINPLMSFSSEEIKTMSVEVDDICNDSDDDEGEVFNEEDDDSREPKDQTSSSSESLAGDSGPRGWANRKDRKRPHTGWVSAGELSTDDEEGSRAKFHRGEQNEDTEDHDDMPDNDDSLGSDGDWCIMGAALEREFLSGNMGE